MITFSNLIKKNHKSANFYINDCTQRPLEHHYWFFKKPLMFLPIQKNASSSVKFLLGQEFNIRDEYKDKPFWFTVIRDPLERFKSTVKMTNGPLALDQIKWYLTTYHQNWVSKAPDWLLSLLGHFLPQKNQISHWQTEQDVKFFSVHKLHILERHLKEYSKDPVHIPIINKSLGRSQQSSEEIDKWMSDNMDWISEFISIDTKWLTLLDFEK